MSRKLFTLCSAISLLLCAAVCVLWITTQDRTRCTVFGDSPTTHFGVGSGRGVVSVARVVTVSAPRDREFTEQEAFNWRRRNGGHGNVLSAMGVNYYDETFAQNNLLHLAGLRSFRILAVEHGTLVVLTIALPALWLYHARRRQILRNARRHAGLCHVCGYDVRGTPDRCQECGAAGTMPPSP